MVVVVVTVAILLVSPKNVLAPGHPYAALAPVIAISKQVSRGEPTQHVERRVMKITAYTARDKGMNGKGITANGEKALDGQTIAADSSIPFGTEIYIPALGKMFTVTDRGGAIHGDRLDLFMESKRDAMKFGVQELEVVIKR